MMPSSYTANYKLNQWEAGDRVLRTDFNADNAKLDAALAKKSEVAFGSYTGNGAASWTISLGFTPKAVLVVARDGNIRTTGNIHGGLALPGSPAKIGKNAKDLTAVSIVSGGFQVFYDTSDSYYSVLANSKDEVYHYIAFA